MELKIRGDTKSETIENISFLILATAALFTIVGTAVGTYVSGFPVALAVVGAFLVVVGILTYVIAEFYALLKEEE